MRIRFPVGLVGLAGWLCVAVTPASAQETLERSPGLAGGWTGYPGLLQVNLPYRFERAGPARRLTGVPTFEIALGVPGSVLLGGRAAIQSPVIAGRPDEWEVFGRVGRAADNWTLPLDAALTLGYNGAARSVDGELSLARWLGPARALGAVRAFTNAWDEDAVRVALAGGAVLHQGSAPVALAGDVTVPLDRAAGERMAWSAAIQLGVSHTTHTLSLFATNSASSTLQGLSRGVARTRWGFEFTAPIPLGRFLGWYVPREEAAEAVRTGTPATDGAVRVEIARYLFGPKQIVVPAGSTVEWINRDDVVHTVDAEDGSWASGAIQTGETWRATFERPGRYPYYCGPHPFMKGVVIVR